MSVWKGQIYRVMPDGQERYCQAAGNSHQGKHYDWVREERATTFPTIQQARKVLEEIKHRHRNWQLRLVMV